MLAFPNCKINLGLHILNKREDGFHNLETVFYPVAIKDALEIIPNPTSKNQIEFTNSGMLAETNEENNLCVKAYHLLKKDFSQLPAVKMHLHKAIPIGAGLGGGSSDAAITLKLLNEIFHLNLSNEQLMHYATQLGSDCPFFIINNPCIATGRGEILEEIEIDLSAYQILLINPGIHVNTGWAFSQLQSFSTNISLKQIIKQPIEKWKEVLQNNFEKCLLEKFPEIHNIKTQLYEMGAVYAAMSGSGSSVFGLFPKTAAIKSQFPENYFTSMLAL
jgi:4-diphosphocytidyl-2-C-methyl-D-erythritol kinase